MLHNNMFFISTYYFPISSVQFFNYTCNVFAYKPGTLLKGNVVWLAGKVGFLISRQFSYELRNTEQKKTNKKTKTAINSFLYVA